MRLRVHVWPAGDGSWRALCPSLQAGVCADTREQALRAIKNEIRDEVEMVFNSEIRVIDAHRWRLQTHE